MSDRVLATHRGGWYDNRVVPVPGSGSLAGSALAVTAAL